MKLSELRAQQASPEQPKRLKLSEVRAQQAAQSVPQNEPAAAVAAPPQESREDELRRKALEDITAGMSTFDQARASFGRGLVDAYQAVQQIAMKSMETGMTPLGPGVDLAFKFAPEGFKRALARKQSDLNEQVKRENQEFEHGLGQTWTGWGGRLLGNAAATAPLGGPASGASFLGNVGRAAASGAAGAVLATPATGDGNFAVEKAIQGVAGAGGGAIGSAVGQGIGKLVERAGIGNLVRAGYNALAGSKKDSAFAKAGERLKADYGVDMTPGHVTGSRNQLTVENMNRESFIGQQAIFDNDMKIADQYATAVGRTVDKLSKNAADPEAAGRALKAEVNDAVEKLTRYRNARADVDFKKVDKLAKGAPVIRPAAYRDQLNQLLREYGKATSGDEHDLAQALRKMVADSDSLESAEGAILQRRHLSRVAGGQSSFAGTAGQGIQKRAAAQLLSALDADVDDAAGKGVGSLGEALKEANKRYAAYTSRIEAIRKGPIGKILGEDIVDKTGSGVGDVAPEAIYQRFLSLAPSQIEYAMKHMSPDGAQTVKRAFVQRALESAQMSTAAGGAEQSVIRPTSFIKALQADGSTANRQRLRALFSADELKELDDLMDIGRRIGDQSFRNTSRTDVRAEARGLVDKAKEGTVRAAFTIGSQVLGAREIAKIMAASEGRRALIRLRKLPRGSAEARRDIAYLLSLAAAKETDEMRQNEPQTDQR